MAKLVKSWCTNEASRFLESVSSLYRPMIPRVQLTSTLPRVASRQHNPLLHRARSSKPATTGTTGTTTLTAEQNQELVKYGLILIGICIVARECWPLRRWRACTLSYFFRSNCMASKPVRGWTPFTPRRN
jgi:hypothetical protein